jgi:hypothetical protein
MYRRTTFTSVALALVVGAAFVCPVSSFATGGSTWKMTLRNPTKWKAHVLLSYGFTTADRYVEAGSTYTLDIPGGLCPVGFVGLLTISDSKNVQLRSANCLGHDVPSVPGTSCCWNVDFEICQKAGLPGSADADVKDYDYGFCKR